MAAKFSQVIRHRLLERHLALPILPKTKDAELIRINAIRRQAAILV